MVQKTGNILVLGLLASALAGCFDVVDKVEPSTRIGNPTPVNPATAGNNPPSISGSPSSSATIGRAWSFTPTASDPDGDAITFTVTNSPRWASFDTSTGQLSGIPLLGDQGDYSDIQIGVTDGENSSTLPGFSVSVQSFSSNDGPLISGAPNTDIAAGDTYSFVPTASDAENDPLTFSIANRPEWATFSSATGQLTGVPFIGDAGLYQNIVISVSDGQQSASLPAFTINVRSTTATNQPPIISGTPPSTAAVDELYIFQPTASDPDGDALVFTIANPPVWSVFNPNTGQLGGTPVAGQEGVYTNIQIFVGDGQATTALPEFSISVDNPNANDAPTISGVAPGAAAVDQPYSFRPSASDADGDTLTFSISNLPSWATFDIDSGELAGTPLAGDEGVYRSIVITVSDGNLTASLAPFSITVDDPNANDAPTISGTAPSNATVDQPYSFQPNASDADGDTLTFSISNLPSWANFDTDTGELAGTPLSGDEGDYGSIIISVSDGDLSDSLAPFSITVDDPNANNAPTISGTAPATATIDQPYSFQPSASDADDDTLTFSISNQPSWATFDIDTGELAGTPVAGDEAEYSSIVITVSDGDLSASLAPFSITVSQAATGSVTLNWTAPTLNTNTSPLTDLTAYKIYYGTSSGNYPNEIRLDNPGLTTYVIENLSVGTYYFVATSINSAEVESDFSNEATKTVN